MPTTFIVEPCGLPRWSPWSQWLESGRRQPRCVWLPQQTPKRGHELTQQREEEQQDAKRLCCRRERPAAETGGFRQSVRVAGYRPEEVRVRLSADGQVTVSACHRERSDAGFSHSRMVRRLSLPKHVQADRLSCRLTSEGELVLEAPAAPKKRVMVVPVTYDAPAVKGVEDKTDEDNKKTEDGQQTEKANVAAEKEVRQEPAQEDAAVKGQDVEEVADATPAKETAKDTPMESETVEASESQDAAPQPAEAVSAETNADAAVKAAEVVDLEAAVGDRDEPVPVEVRSGSPTSEPGQNSVLASVDVSSFRPEEVEVRVSGRQLLVEAVHEETAADGSSCQLRLARRLPLPDHVDSDLVTSRLTRAGQLVLEAPVAHGAAPCA